MWQARPGASRAYSTQERGLVPLIPLTPLRPLQRGFQAGQNLFASFTVCSQERSRPGKRRICAVQHGATSCPCLCPFKRILKVYIFSSLATLAMLHRSQWAAVWDSTSQNTSLMAQFCRQHWSPPVQCPHLSGGSVIVITQELVKHAGLSLTPDHQSHPSYTSTL